MRTSISAGGALFAAAAVLVVACSTSESDPPAIPSGASSGGQANSGTLAAHAHTVQSLPVGMDDTSITFADNAETQALAPGDTIASATRIDSPYLRTVQSVTRAGGQATFTTTDAALTDLFASLHISQVIALDDPANATDNGAITGAGDDGSGDDDDAGADASSGTGGDAAASGDDAAPGDDDAASDAGDDDASGDDDGDAGGQPHSVGPHPLYIHPLDQPAITAGTFSPGGSARLSPSGGLSIDASESYVHVSGGVQFDYDYDSIFNPAPTKMTLALNGAIAVHVGGDITGKAGVNYRSNAVSWASPTLAIVWFTVGVVPVPVVITLDLSTQFFAKFKGDLRFHAGTTVSFTMQEGVQYVNGGFQPLDNHALTRTDDPFKVEGGGADVDFSFYPAITTFYMRPFKIVGPYAQLKPLLEIECNEFTGNAANSSSVDFYADVGVQPGIDGSVDVFGFQKDVGPFNLPAIDKHYLLATIAEACATPQTGPKGAQYCNSESLRSCLASNPLNNACATTAEPSGSGKICGAPSDQDVSCNFDQLLPCLCNAASGNTSSTADGGDCYAQHCVSCPKGNLVCASPN